MGLRYMVLDYQNNKLIHGLLSPRDVCLVLDAIHNTYSNSWAVCTHNENFVTAEFVERDGKWIHDPAPQEFKE